MADAGLTLGWLAFVGAARLVVASALTWSAARRWAALGASDPSDVIDELGRAGLLALALATWQVALLGVVGVLDGWALTATAALVAVAARLTTRAAGNRPHSGPAGESAAGATWALVLTAVLVAYDVTIHLATPPADWDAMTYHLYLPARWLQEGGLVHVPTVFSDNAAAFAPQNGALFFTWQMALLGSDASTNVSQALALALVVGALFGIGRRLGLRRESALLAALLVVWLPPVRRWTFSANVDILLLAAWAFAVCWTLDYLRRPSSRSLTGAALAAGLAAGTKVIGLPLAALLAATVGLAALVRRRPLDLVRYTVWAMAAGGWWYLLNAWRYGNPFFPLAVDLGPIHLAGAYEAAAIRAGEFHRQLGDVAALLWRHYGAAGCVLSAAGLSLLLARSWSRPGGRAAWVAGTTTAAAAYYFFVIPHNAQTRFLLPAVALALVGCGVLFERCGRLAPVLWTVAALALATSPLLGWQVEREGLEAAGVGLWSRLVEMAVLLLAAGALVRLSRRLPRRLVASLGGLLALVVCVRATADTERSRIEVWRRAPYGVWADGFLPLAEARLPDLRIAYCGANVPYTLTGEGWRHQVFYVDIQGEQGDGFYQHWRRDPRRHPYHKPGLYRGAGDVERWLGHLDALAVDVLVVFRLHPVERRYLAGDSDGFPVERRWARARPDLFEPLWRGPWGEIYRLVTDDP